MAFDQVAASYDTQFAAAPAARLFRFRSMERLLERVGSRRTILDVGCGTGEDGIWLASLGFDVTGVDSSAEMIAAARSKAASARSTARFEQGTLDDVVASGRRADVVMSNFGAMNCVETKTWTSALPSLLSTSGIGHVVLMGPRPLPESLRLGSGSARDRRSSGSALVGGSRVSVTYEGVDSILYHLEAHGRVTGVEALGCVVPGPGFSGFASRHPTAMALTAAIEAVVRRLPLFRGGGDHFLVEFEAR